MKAMRHFVMGEGREGVIVGRFTILQLRGNTSHNLLSGVLFFFAFRGHSRREVFPPRPVWLGDHGSKDTFPHPEVDSVLRSEIADIFCFQVGVENHFWKRRAIL